ncbi:chaperonin-like RbcX protein 2, chloroplastic [Phalaenopsis equestris]|uniref:chaperonin-like RbcX protein 2, chloroplastic n=1 Tax=Phalaenopsis equestris TaxID=78828 RepID=UPI0009E3E618|nr:chaperonin-like RbcX protein 2, chloroplastic [Phalaenopsis equestris]
MAGAQTMVIGHIPSGFSPRSSSGDLGLCSAPTCRRTAASPSSVGLCSSFMGGWVDRWRPAVRSKKKRGRSRIIVDEIAGQYEESFEDIHAHLINFFTYKAVRTVLHQLYEMNPPKYIWFYNFVSNNQVKDGARFLRSLGKEHQELAERVMVTRLHLYGKWIKKCDHAMMYQRISDENLKLMRERLMETVIWPSEDTNAENLDS